MKQREGLVALAQQVSNDWFLGLLVVVFITLKLIGVISWSWWWVLAPIWVPMAIALVILIVWWLARK